MADKAVYISCNEKNQWDITDKHNSIFPTYIQRVY